VAEFSVLAPSDAGVAAVASLRLSLLAVMDKAGPGDSIVLDLGKLATADSALAQLVIAFRQEAKLREQKAVVEGEDSKLSVAGLLGCDVVCEACTFNALRGKVDSGPGSDMLEVRAMPGLAARTKGAEA